MRNIDIQTVETDAFQRIEQALCHIPDASRFAVRHLVKDAQRHVRTEVYRAVPQIYAIKEKTIRSRDFSQSIKALPVQYQPGHGARGDLLVRGANISLTKFEGTTHADRRRAVLIWYRTNWKTPGSWTWSRAHPSITAKGAGFRGTAARTLDNPNDAKRGAFYARVKAGKNGATHDAIWERVGNPADFRNYTSGGIQRLRELKGTALPKMVGNEKVYSAIGQDYDQYLDTRATHYIDLILQNGVPARRGGRT